MTFLQSLSAVGRPLTTAEIFINLVLAFLLGVLIAGVYRLTNRDKSVNPSLMHTLVILAMVVALVMMVIGNSIARAFSLVGALSIIRFRTVVKDNRDIAFVFFALAAGMSAGVGYYRLSIYGVGMILFFLLLMDFIRFGRTPRGLYLLRFQLIPSDTEEEALLEVFNKLLASHRRISVKTVRMGQYIEHTYLVRLKKDVTDQGLLSALSAVEGMERVTLLAEDDEVEM